MKFLPKSEIQSKTGGQKYGRSAKIEFFDQIAEIVTLLGYTVYFIL